MASYPRVLERVLGALFWGLIAVLVLAGAAAFYFVVWGNAETNLAVPISFVPDPAVVSLSSTTYGAGSIIYGEGMASFDEVGGAWHVVRAVALAIALIVPALVSLWLLRAFAKTVADRRPFQSSSVTLIRTIGVLVVASELLWGTTSYLLERSVAAQVTATGVTLGANLSFNIPLILLGLVILAIAEVLRHGIALQADVDLTV